MKDLITQILAMVSDQERNESKRRQAQGIQIAKEKGVYKGRPLLYSPNAKDSQKRIIYHRVVEMLEEGQAISKIAIRRAFGAKARNIELQFLIESVVLCVIGGLIGLILGILIGNLVDAVTPDYIKSVVSLGSVLTAVGVSMLIGIVLGWIPARAASKKELIDIIK